MGIETALHAADRLFLVAGPEGSLRVVLIALMLASAPALADDKAACTDGIAMIRDALAKGAPEATLVKLRKSLRIAEREQGEAEYDECLDAVGDAKRALAR